MKSLIKIWSFFNKKQKIQSIYLLFGVLIATNLEIVGISSFLPIVAAIVDYDRIKDYPYIAQISQNLSQKEFIYICLVSTMAIYFTKNLFLLIFLWFHTRFNLNVHRYLINKLYSTYMNIDYLFHLKTNSAQLLTNIQSGASHTKFYIDTYYKLIVEIVLLISIFLLLLIIEPYSTLVTSIFCLTMTGILFLYSKNKLLQNGKLKIVHEANINRLLISSLHGIKEVQILDRQDGFEKNLNQQFVDVNKLELNYIILTSLPRISLEVIGVFSFVIFIVVLLIQNQSPSDIIPLIALFSISFIRILPSVVSVVQNLQFRKYHKPAFELIFDELKMLKKANFIDKKDKFQISEFNKKNIDIFFDKFFFKYQNFEKNILRNINLKISHGEVLGIVGSSGSGKTTFVDNLLGLLKPSAGTILANDKDIQTNIHQWQKKIGYVSQSIFIMDASIEENITFGIEPEKIDKKLMEYALNSAKLIELNQKLSNSTNPRVGENGVRLSGGQRQRIGIARALYRNPSILLLDEATNSLDKDTENQILDVIRNLKKEKTVILISHDKNSLRYCDRIISLNNGYIEEINL
jgi:ABC-type bacteriocin/lantibiotic exporter with double-glycine peptidase domain